MTRTILLADDNEANRYLARFALERAGFRVVTAGDGEEALRQARAHRPDLVLMDVQMPILDGLEATERLRADPELAAIPVVALTAYVAPEDKVRAREAGCSGHIAKPIDALRFAEQVTAFLAARDGV
jgi:CheY-like chemotaxis protein